MCYIILMCHLMDIRVVFTFLAILREFLKLYVFVCACFSLCAPHICRYPWSPEEGIKALELELQANVDVASANANPLWNHSE